MRWAVIAAVVLLLAACSTSTRDVPDYEPVPDARLFDQVAGVDGIASADLSYSSTVGDEGYRGTVRVAPDLDRSATVDAVNTVYAVLRQGRYRAPMSLQFIQGNQQLQFLPGLPSNGSSAELERVYGPQPGDGTPPPR